MPFLDRPWYEDMPGRRFRLLRPLEYQGETETFRIPEGYVTDFASVPQSFYGFFPPYGAYTRAAILHDWLITDRPDVSSRDTDGLFRRVMREEGTPFAIRWLMWSAVRLAAPFNPKRRPARLWRDLPALLLAAVPGVLIVAVGALVFVTRVILVPNGRQR